MGYRLLAHEGERDNCFSKIILVSDNYKTSCKIQMQLLIVAIQGGGGGGVEQGVKSYITRIVELPRNKNLLRT